MGARSTIAETGRPARAGALLRALPAGAVLALGNSMPVRDIDTYAPPGGHAITVLHQRGASGIDGVISGAAGAAAVAEGPVALMIGDLSFLHDVNGLWPIRRHDLSLTVVLVTHEHDIAEFASRVVSFRDGRVIEDRPVDRPKDAAAMAAQLRAGQAAERMQP